MLQRRTCGENTSVSAIYTGLPKILGGDTNCLWVRNTSAAMGIYAPSPNVDPATLLGPIEDTTDIWASMRSDVRDAEAAQGYHPIILFHPTAGRIARPVSTPEAYGPLPSMTQHNQDTLHPTHWVLSPHTILGTRRKSTSSLSPCVTGSLDQYWISRTTTRAHTTTSIWTIRSGMRLKFV